MQNVMQAHVDIVHRRPVESILCPSGQKGCLTERQPSLKDGQEKMARSPRAIEAAVSWALSTASLFQLFVRTMNPCIARTRRPQ